MKIKREEGVSVAGVEALNLFRIENVSVWLSLYCSG